MKKRNNVIRLTESELRSVIRESVEAEIKNYYLQEGKFGNAVKSGLKTAGIAAAMVPAAVGLGIAHDEYHKNDRDPMQDEINQQVADFERGNKYGEELDSIRKAERGNAISWDEANEMRESRINRIVAESIKKYLVNEIGDTKKGQYALNAVAGRASARPRYHNSKYNSVPERAKQDKIRSNAYDAAWNARKKVNKVGDKEFDDYGTAGYQYGYKKGMEG